MSFLRNCSFAILCCIVIFSLVIGDSSVHKGKVIDTNSHSYDSFFVYAQSPIEYEFNISVSGLGTTDPEPGDYLAEEESIVDIFSIPEIDWKLDYWLLNDQDYGSNSSISVIVDMNISLVAVFVEDVQNQTDEFLSLTILTQGSGTTNPEPGAYEDIQGTEVYVEAVPEEGWIFQNWDLDGTNAGTSSSYSFTLNANSVLTAVFTQGVTDTTGPTIYSPEFFPETPTKDDTVTINCDVFDEESEVASVILLYSVSGTDWIQVSMTFDGQSWTGIIPQQIEGSLVDFYVVAYDTNNNYGETETFSYETAKQGLDLVTIGIIVGVGIAVILIIFLGYKFIKKRRIAKLPKIKIN